MSGEDKRFPWEYPDMTNQRWIPTITTDCFFCVDMEPHESGGWTPKKDAPKTGRIEFHYYTDDEGTERYSLLESCVKCGVTEPVEGDDLWGILKALTGTKDDGIAIMKIARWRELYEHDQRMGLQDSGGK